MYLLSSMFSTPKFTTLAVGLFLLNSARWTSAADLEEWRARTIYQVLTDRFARFDGSSSQCNELKGHYCGGSWKGIEQNLDYIQGMNFDAIWISPIVAQLPQSTGDGQAYTGYWAQDLYALNSHFGSASNLESLIKAAHDRDMLIMLDVVVNHMGYAGSGRNVHYNVLAPFNDEKYFHDYCAVDASSGNQTNVEVCWLGSDIVALADLRTEDDDVRDMLGSWISEIVSRYSIDGLRIDTALNVEPGFFSGFVDAAGVFATGETMSGDLSYACQWEDDIGSLLNYPIYYPLVRAFSSAQGNINDLTSTIYDQYANCGDPTTFGIFSENHDVERFASVTNDTALAKNILTFTILFDGIPIIYQGQEQHVAGGISPYLNRAPLWESGFNTSGLLYEHVATLVRARQHFIKTSDRYTVQRTNVVYQDYHTFAMRKGVDGKQIITVLTNNGAATDNFKLHIKGHGYESGTELTEILTCTNITVDHKGRLNVPMGVGLPKVLYPAELLRGSGLCGMEAPSPTTVITAYPTTISGQATQISTTVTKTDTATATSSHTTLSLGSANVRFGDPIAPLAVTVLTTFLISFGCFYTW